jgi:hypothetical protein
MLHLALKYLPLMFASGVATSFAEYKFDYSLYGSVSGLVAKIFHKKAPAVPTPPVQ